MQIKISAVQKIVYGSMFTVISLILAFFIKFPVIPATPYLKFDISDVPVFVATMLLGPQTGLSILLCVCSLRCILFSSAGIVGFVIRMTSSINVLFLGYLYNKPKNIVRTTLTIILSIFACLIIKIPLNYVFWVYFWGIPKANLDEFMLSVIIPFNIIKIIVNSVLSVYVSRVIEKFLSRNKFTYH